MKFEKQLWGTKNGAEDWEEQLLISNATESQIEQVKSLAAKDGFGRFRVNSLPIPETLAETRQVENKASRMFADCINQ